MKQQILKTKEIIRFLEQTFPLPTQESYDNSGLLTGNAESLCNSVIICLDVTAEVVDEAVKNKISLIISHHPFIFGGLKKITGKTESEKILIKAIKNDIAIYAIHTNFDSSRFGMNISLAEMLGLKNVRILKPASGQLKKLVTFVPEDHSEKVRKAMFEAGAGHIGNYDSCSYNLNGEGTFRPLEGTNPYTGKKGSLHFEKETRIETIVPFYKADSVISAMKKAHPYEEVAYDIYPLDNADPYTGIGAVGDISKAIGEKKFLDEVRKKTGCKMIRYSDLLGRDVKRVAVCGGSGSFLIGDAIRAGADVFITGDLKYHQFQEAEKRIVLVDIGHFESEKHFLVKMKDVLMKNFTNFAVRISKTNTNPVNYL